MGYKTWSRTDLEYAVNNSKTYAGILNHLKMCKSSYNYATIKKYIKLYSIDISHFEISTHTKKRIPLSNILVKNSTYRNNSNLKRRTIEKELLENKCSICGINPIWNSKKLSLQLDHKNGVRNDNRIENLRLLCPNCHSQTKNYAGKNTDWAKSINQCVDCGKQISKHAVRCRKCFSKSRITTKPASKEHLTKLLQEYKMTWVDISKIFGVSDTTIKKWAKQYGIR